MTTLTTLFDWFGGDLTTVLVVAVFLRLRVTLVVNRTGTDRTWSVRLTF